MDREYLRSDEETMKIIEQKALHEPSSIPDECLPTQAYLEKFVLPYMEPALKAVAKERPKNPV